MLQTVKRGDTASLPLWPPYIRHCWHGCMLVAEILRGFRECILSVLQHAFALERLQYQG